MASDSKDKIKAIFVLGGPGAGKGTQCENIAEHFGFVHLSAGDLIRKERIREGSQHGQIIDEYLENGKIVPVDVTCSLLENAINLNKEANGIHKFLIDGFPINQENLDGWNIRMGAKVDVQFVLFFDCTSDICVERCLERGKYSGRSDDNEDSLKRRIKTYTNESFPIIQHFLNMNLVKRVDARPDAEEVFKSVRNILQQHDL